MKSSQVQACALVEDDHFEMAGEMYRIATIRKDSFGNYVINAYPIDGSPLVRIEIQVPRDTPFKIYNQ